MMKARWRALLCAALFAAAATCAPACGGYLEGGSDSDCEGATCPGPDADIPDRGGPCERVTCGAGQVCVDGRCLVQDLCADVTCENPGDVCDPRLGACLSGAADDDGDGVTLGQGDCDDSDPTIRPGSDETCDGVDQDCDREVDEGFPDADGDGYDICGFGVVAQADCDDGDAARNPGRAEDCNGKDDDCDGAVDDGLEPRPCSTACGSGEERCEGGGWRCSAPELCECTPAGLEDERSCGYCGTKRRTCQADLTWSDWGACTDEGECAAGASVEQECGNCGDGTQRRSCSSTCAWGAWSDCTLGGDAATCLGCEVDVGSAGDGGFLGDGWYAREGSTTTARWTNGRGVLVLGVSPGATTISFVWSGRSYTTSCDVQPGDQHHGRLLIDGRNAGTFSLPSGVWSGPASFAIPAGAADDGWLEVEIVSDYCFRPSECMGTADTRCLGVMVDRVSAC